MQAHQRLPNIACLRRILSLGRGLVLSMAALFIIASASPAKAFEYDDVPKLKLEAGMAQSDFQEETQVVEETPSGNKAMAYRMRLPKDWKEVGGDSGLAGGDLQLSSSLLSTVSHYRGPGSLQGRSFFKLKARKLRRMITARKWFMHFILNEGYSLESVREISPRRVAARYTIFRGDTSYTVLAVAAINGDQLVLGEYYVPTARMDEDRRDRQTLSMRSFTLTNQIDKPAEPIETYEFIDIASVDYPASWLVKAPRVRNIDKMKVTFYNTKEDKLKRFSDYVSRDNFKGRIRIKMIARNKVDSVSDQLKQIRRQFRQRGLNADNLIREIEGIEYDEDFDLARTQAYTVSDESGSYLDFQLWVSIMRSPDYYVFATLFTPDRDNEYYNWAVNGEAFKFMLSRLDIR